MPPEPTSTSPLADAIVVLVRTQGPINLGMVARLCGNFGVGGLRLVAPGCEIDCAEARMFSTHSKELLLAAPVFPTLAAATADCGLVIGSSARFRERELGAGLHPHEVPRLRDRRPASRYALVFGNEADGLNDEELRACQAWIHLQSFGTNAAYNLANAVAITLYQVATADPPAPSEVPPAAAREHVDDLYRFWLATLARFQYFRRTDPVRFAPQLSNFIGRLHLTTHDVQVMRGMLAQFNYFTFGDRGLDGPGEPPPSADPPTASGAAPTDPTPPA